MTLFKRGHPTPDGFSGKPDTGAQPKGGYGAAEVPGRAQKYSAPKDKPSGGYGSYGKHKANKPAGGYGTSGKPRSGKPQGGYGARNKSAVKQKLGKYGNDGMATPKTPIPKDQKKGRFNLPKGKFTYS